MENQAHRIPVENFFRREGVKAELQILFREGILLWPSGFVIHNFYFISAERIDLVHAADDDDIVVQRQFEPFFLFENLWWLGHDLFIKGAQLLDTIFFVFPFLVLVFEADGAPFRFENSLHVVERQLVPLAQFTQNASDGVMHDAAEAQRRPWSFP